MVDADHVARDLVPLVRAAADEVPVGDVPHVPLGDTKPGFFLRWDEAIQEHLHAEMAKVMEQAMAAVPPPTIASGADILAAIYGANDRIKAMPPPFTGPIFMTQRQFDLLKQHTKPTPYIQRPHDLGVIGQLAGVQVVVLPKRTRWQRLKGWLRRWWR